MFNRLRTALRLETRTTTGTLADPWTAIMLGGYGPTAARITVTPETALRFAPVHGAIRVLAETLQSLPVHLFRKLADGGRERAEDHPVERLLSDAANDWTPAGEFRLILQTLLSLHGNAFAYVGRLHDQVRELIPLPHGTVTVETNSVTHEPVYVVSSRDGPRRYDRRGILHIRGIGTSVAKGDSPVALAREAIALGLVLERHAAGLFGRGARPSGVLKYPKMLTDDMLKRLRASWDSRYGGGDNAGRTAVLEDGVSWEQTQLSSVDAQFLEMRKFQLQEVARVWRVPLHLLADLERVTFTNAEQMGQQFITYTIMPILRAWQDALRITLLSPEERRAGLFIEFILDDLARADIAGRFTAYSQAINAGILNPNEIRAMENRGAYAGGEVFTRPVNTAAVAESGGADGT